MGIYVFSADALVDALRQNAEDAHSRLVVQAGARVGLDPEVDARRYTVSSKGVVPFPATPALRPPALATAEMAVEAVDCRGWPYQPVGMTVVFS
jgi:hypothetical protein